MVDATVGVLTIIASLFAILQGSVWAYGHFRGPQQDRSSPLPVQAAAAVADPAPRVADQKSTRSRRTTPPPAAPIPQVKPSPVDQGSGFEAVMAVVRVVYTLIIIPVGMAWAARAFVVAFDPFDNEVFNPSTLRNEGETMSVLEWLIAWVTVGMTIGAISPPNHGQAHLVAKGVGIAIGVVVFFVVLFNYK